MAYNTGNPPGSTSPKDLIDNAEDLDFLMTGIGASHPNRLGVPLKSWKGMEGEHNADQIRREAEFDADQSRRESEFDDDQTRRESEFDIDQDNRELQFNNFMDASGYEPPIPYAPGILLDRTTKTVSYLGNEYRAKGSFIPMTTSTWAVDEVKLKLVGDDSLRQEQANSSNPEKGSAMLGRGVVSVDGIQLLLSQPRRADLRFQVRGYHVGSLSGGGTFYWDASRARNTHNGSTIISPTVPWDGTTGTLAAFLLGTGETAVAVPGCFVRTKTPYSVEFFGAVGDGVTDDTVAIQAAMDACAWRTLLFPKPSVFYRITSTLRLSLGITLKGEFASTENVVLTNQQGIKFEGTGFLFSTNSVYGVGGGVCVAIEGMVLDGNAKANGGIFSAIQRLKIVGNIFRGFDAAVFLTAYAISGVVENLLTHNYFVSNNHGITGTRSANWSSANRNTDGVVSENWFVTNAQAGIDIDGSYGWAITDNHFYSGGLCPYNIRLSGFGCDITGNYGEKAATTNIEFTASSGDAFTTISGNRIFVMANGFGITVGTTVVSGTDGIIVDGNIVSATGSPANSTGIAVVGSYRVFNGFHNNFVRGVTTRYVLSNAGGSISVAGQNNAGNFGIQGYNNLELMGGAWNSIHLVMGSNHIWVDSVGRLRIKNSSPTSDTDGTIVGAQS